MELRTQRLTLVLQTREELERILDAMSEYDLAQVSAEWLARMRASKAPDPWSFGFRILDSATGTAVGMCSFKGPPADGTVEIAYGIDPEHEGNGYATEAATALLELAASRDDVRLVIAHTLPDAAASKRVLAKCGFQYVGETVDPEDGLVSRFEWSVPSAVE
jgi:ribosomal-protein-alanine N-acetyltransferase